MQLNKVKKFTSHFTVFSAFCASFLLNLPCNLWDFIKPSLGLLQLFIFYTFIHNWCRTLGGEHIFMALWCKLQASRQNSAPTRKRDNIFFTIPSYIGALLYIKINKNKIWNLFLHLLLLLWDCIYCFFSTTYHMVIDYIHKYRKSELTELIVKK